MTPAPISTQAPAWPRRTAAALAAVLTLVAPLPPAWAQVRLPSLGETSETDLGIADERRIGDAFMREGRRDPQFLDDPLLQDYLDSLWRPLLAAARDQGHIGPELETALAWEAFLVLDRAVNAFALPGGYVGINLGLIAITQSRDELASVLAHELAHVTQRHIARSIAPNSRASTLAAIATILGLVLASRGGNIDAANAAIMGGQGAAAQAQINYTRDFEREADRVGFGVLQGAGFAIGGQASMFERLDQASRLNDSGGFAYLRTHPLTTDRIAEARNRTLVAGSGRLGPPMLHAIMAARSRVLMDPNPANLRRLLGGTSSPVWTDRVQAAAMAGMAAQTLGDLPLALRELGEALRLAQSAPQREPAAEQTLVLLQAEALLAQGGSRGPREALDRMAMLRPGDGMPRSLLLLRSRAALAAWRQQPGPTEVAELRRHHDAILTWVVDHRADAAAWQLLADGNVALGQPLRALRASAEARYALGDLTGAVDRLRAAQARVRGGGGESFDFIEASVIDARLRAIQEQRRQIALDMRGGRGAPRNDPSRPDPSPPEADAPQRPAPAPTPPGEPTGG
ncbi:MAG: M48 family metalloprotease [Rubrivivax sp.]|nr:M48 family metalloprotease [Rubrivivax sp.]